MASRRIPASGNGSQDALSAVERSKIEEELTVICVSPQFKASRRSSRFLSFIVEKAISGEADSLKERTLGIELFGRDPSFDTAGDASVRVAAGEVRKRLAQFYQENTDRGLRISLPAGSYVPEFLLIEETGEVADPVPPPKVQRGASWLFLSAAGAASLLLVATGVWVGRWQPRPLTTSPELEAFWQPVLNSTQPALISLGIVPTHYALLPALERMRMAQPIPPELIPASGYAMVPLGDSVALARITELLSQRRKAFRVRGSLETSFPDLRDSAAILIGAKSNSWTVLSQSGLRYSIGSLPPNAKTAVIDSKDTANRRWTAEKSWPEPPTKADYAVISRLSDPNTGAWIITVAGLTPFGTQAAGEFLTDPVRLSAAIRALPRDWKSKTLQLVLRTQIVGSSGGPAVVVAADSH